MLLSPSKQVTGPRGLDRAGLLAIAAAPVFTLMSFFSAIGAPDMAMPRLARRPFRSMTWR